MSLNVRRVDYFNTEVRDRPGEAYRLLSSLAAQKVNLLAFNAVPFGAENTQLVLFPEDTDQLTRVAERADLVLHGPFRAFLIQGDDELGALAEIHLALANVGVNVYASSGVTDSRGGFGYIIYVRPEQFEDAARALSV